MLQVIENGLCLKIILVHNEVFIPARARAWAKSFDVMENPAPGFEPPPAAPLDGVEPEGIVKFPNELEVEAPPAADVGGLWLVKPAIPPIPAN